MSKHARLRTLMRPLATILGLVLITGAWLAVSGPTTAAPPDGTSPIVAKSDEGKAKSRVSGTTDDGRRVAGTFTPEAFSVVEDQLMATGTLDLVLRGGGPPEYVSEEVTVPVRSINGTNLAGLASSTQAPGACDILHLDLGPLDLDLLGLVIHLDEIVLDIVAQPGPGNLLGNLLCAVAGLLDGPGPIAGLLDQIVGLLEQILGALDL